MGAALDAPGVAHPLVDAYGMSEDGGPFVVTESRASVVFLEPGRVNLLRLAAERGTRVVLVTDELSNLTPAFAEVWRAARAGWVVRSPVEGLRDGFTGRRLAHPSESLDDRPVTAPKEVAVGFLRGGSADAIEMT